MATREELARHLNERVRGAIAINCLRADRELPLSVREAMTHDLIGEFVTWLCSTDVRTAIAAALTQHEVDASSVTGCEHHKHRDCQEERAWLMAVRAGALSGFDG